MQFQVPACESGAARPSCSALLRTQHRRSSGVRKGLLSRAAWVSLQAGALVFSWQALVRAFLARGRSLNPAGLLWVQRLTPTLLEVAAVQRLARWSRWGAVFCWGLWAEKLSANLPYGSPLEQLYIAVLGIYRVALIGRQQKAQIYQNEMEVKRTYCLRQRGGSDSSAAA